MPGMRTSQRAADRVPWQAATTIILSLTAGVLLAVGHHVFYDNLHGRQAGADDWEILGSRVSPQQLNIAIGTALAYLVKTFLLLALSTAYLQLIWRSLLRTSKGFTLGDLDIVFSGLSNIISVAKVWVWRKLPLLFALAVVAWLLPLAAIVTPATLSIETAQVWPPPSSLQRVPSLGFESLSFVDDMPPVRDDNSSDTLRFAYTIPSREVIEVVKAVAATGSLLPITPPDPNSTWALDFTGPTLRCSNIPQTLRSRIVSNIAAAADTDASCAAYGYLAWLGDLPFVRDPEDHASIRGGYNFNSRIFKGSSMPAILYLVASPHAMRIAEHGSPPAACSNPVEDMYGSDSGAVMLQCALQSSLYSTTFNYTNGLQEIRVDTDVIDDSPVQTVTSINCTASGDSHGSCDISQGVLRTMSFQAIMDAVTYLITGYVEAQENSTSPFIASQVISTALISTPELNFLTQPILEQDSTAGARTLQQNMLAWTNTRDRGLVRTSDRLSASSLGETIEQLFKNATVSMMSQSHLHPNASSEFAHAPVQVTRQTFHNVYTYSKAKLWIAYSAAIFCSAVSTLLGLLTITTSGASYSSSNSFSSAFRLARGANLSTEVRAEDMDGRDPLPEHLASAKMWPEKAHVGPVSRVDSMLLGSEDRSSSRPESIGLDERPPYRSRRSSTSLLTISADFQQPSKAWSAV